MSALDFYAKLESTIQEFKFPDVTVSRKSLIGTGILDARREYLCISRGPYRFYVCAAPFGRSYFVSWWFRWERDLLLEWLYRNPIISAIFESKEDTMYKRDTQLMFENAIDSIITEISATVSPNYVRRAAPITMHN